MQTVYIGRAQSKEAALQEKEKLSLRLRGSRWQCLDVVKASLQHYSSGLTCKEFITPLASTAIFPATDLTPCLNWAMSAVGSTFPRDTLPVKARKGVTQRPAGSPAPWVFLLYSQAHLVPTPPVPTCSMSSIHVPKEV